mmetsp:Transcript_39400/g.82529  ORF Transcript_39400/g.82529 Transcript_39400/m.82529 type:complete len:115 (+) Transcript_39400:76-420(+)
MADTMDTVAMQQAQEAWLDNVDLLGEQEVLFMAGDAYVQRLVQASVPWTRPPVVKAKYNTKGKEALLQSLGAEVYDPSAMKTTPAPEQYTGSKFGRPQQGEPLKPLLETLGYER